MKVRLNIDAYKIAITKVRKLINTSLITQLFVVYINGIYIYQKIDQTIRKKSHYIKVNIFLKINTPDQQCVY